MDEEDEAERRREEPSRGDEGRGGDELPGLDELIGTFLSEPTLLPVVIVVLGTGGAFGAALMILTGVDGNLFAAGALVLLAGMTVDISLRARKEAPFRNVALLIGMIWAASVLLAGLALWTGIAY